MPEPVQFQYLIPLTVLDEVDAVFSKDIDSAESDVQVSIPTAHWIELGRPGMVKVTLDPENQS